jgi:uncharacterized protein YkwD
MAMRLAFPLAFFFAGMAAAQTPSPLERGIFNEVDQLRANPPGWADVLKAERPWFPGRAPAIPDEDALSTDAAVRTLEEAIAAVEALPRALPSVEFSPSLSRAASDHVRDTGGRGLTGHRGSDGSSLSQRIERYGKWWGTSPRTLSTAPRARATPFSNNSSISGSAIGVIAGRC